MLSLLFYEVCVYLPTLQVDGKTLCLLCTIKYKKDQFKKKNGTSSRPTTSEVHSATKRSHGHASEHKSDQG